LVEPILLRPVGPPRLGSNANGALYLPRANNRWRTDQEKHWDRRKPPWTQLGKSKRSSGATTTVLSLPTAEKATKTAFRSVAGGRNLFQPSTDGETRPA